MTVIADLDSVAFHLKNASYFNKLWHESIDELLYTQTALSPIETQWRQAQINVLLQQKISCQITALHRAYDDAKKQGLDYGGCQVVLERDMAEMGVSGQGVFYGLYPKEDPKVACHIPKGELLVFLTDKQRRFFNLDF